MTRIAKKEIYDYIYVNPPLYYETEMIPDELAQQIKNTVRRLDELRKVANKYIDRKYDLV